MNKSNIRIFLRFTGKLSGLIWPKPYCWWAGLIDNLLKTPYIKKLYL